jgi:hypothetical protein
MPGAIKNELLPLFEVARVLVRLDQFAIAASRLKAAQSDQLEVLGNHR